MKQYIFLLLFLLCLPLASAQGILLYQHDYVRGETLQFFVEGENLFASQISLYNASSYRIASIAPIVQTIRGDSYAYFNLPVSLATGTYTLKAGQEEVTFDVFDGNDAMQVNPPFIVLDKKEDRFQIEIKNILRRETVSVSSSTDAIRPYKLSKTLEAYDSFNLYVDYMYENISQDESLLVYYYNRSYTIPIFYLGAPAPEVIPEEEVVPIAEEELVSEEIPVALVFLVSTEKIETSLAPDVTLEDTVSVQNQLNTTLSNLTISLTGDLVDFVIINETDVDSLEAGETLTISITVNERGNAVPGIYEGSLIFGNDQYSANLPFSLTVTEEAVPEEEQQVEVVTVGETEQGKEGNTIVIIGFVIIGLLVALVVLVGSKLRQRPQKKFKQYIEETKRKK